MERKERREVREGGEEENNDILVWGGGLLEPHNIWTAAKEMSLFQLHCIDNMARSAPKQLLLHYSFLSVIELLNYCNSLY